ncbi:adenine nucleotide alpha hydrolases-like superfamily protein [Wolffia australiana]
MASGSSPEPSFTAGNLRCVVVAVDGSEESMNALRWAINNLRLDLKDEGAETEVLHVLHVQSPPSIAAGLSPGEIPFGGPRHFEVPAFAAAIEAHQRRISEAIVDHAKAICAEKQILAKFQVVVGDPKEVVCNVTAELNADLLVMGCRSLGPIRRMFLGSVSNYCLNHVHCPVVVIKNDQK